MKVSEHTVGLILTLNRNIHRAYSRVRDGNFSLSGLLGFDLRGGTAGVIGRTNLHRRDDVVEHFKHRRIREVR